MTTLNQDQLNQVELLYKHYKKTDLTRSEINDFIKIGNIKNPSWLKQDQYKVARGVYTLPIDGNDISSQVKEEIQSEYGRISTASTGSILRKIVEIEQQGGDLFFGERSFDVKDLVRTDSDGKGIISVLRLTDIQDKPKLFSTFMLQLLAEV